MHRTIAALALALSLGFTSPSTLLDFDSLWSRLSSLGQSAKEGCGADPDGRCLPKEGGGCDPDGRCLPKEGGRCGPFRSTSTASRLC